MQNENKEGKFTIVKDDGTKVECRPLITYENDGKHYILYTDDTVNENGEINVYAGIYDPDKGEQRFEPVTSDAEIDLVERILSSLNERENSEQ